MLQLGSDPYIRSWLATYCPQTDYSELGYFRDAAGFDKDVERAETWNGGRYRVVIYSGEPGILPDGPKAVRAMSRFLEPDGVLLFLKPETWNPEEIGDMSGMKAVVFGGEFFGGDAPERLGVDESAGVCAVMREERTAVDLACEYPVSPEIMENGPLVSVIMYCYNHEAYVGEAIESVINQSYKNIEFLVADDGSSDDSAAVMQRYSEHLTEEYYFEDNEYGRSHLLLSRAKGKYVALINSDDMWEPEKLAIQVQYLETHPDAAACFTWARCIDENRDELPDAIFYQRNRNRFEWMRYFWEKQNALCHPSIVIRREEYERLHHVANACRQLPDFFMWVNLVQQHELHIIPKRLVNFRRFRKRRSVSDVSRENTARAFVEEMCMWLPIIENMDGDFFKKAFEPYLIRKDAETGEEIMCEKFFLMASSDKLCYQADSFYYFMKIYNSESVRECFTKKYNFTKRDFFNLMVSRGYGKWFMESQ